ncbi:MAG: trypsin-like peptidase domain-containing protein [Paracoccaceae bacterium]|nr:trypsin-like peptidase domain-containing protein [Paracoccaceae bacterium]
MKQNGSHILFGLAISLISAAAIAQDSALETLDSWGRNRGWEGVGQLMISNRSTCTGTMISADLVLTAAHCVFDSEGLTPIAPAQISFRAGWRNGSAVSERVGKALVIHPEFEPGSGNHVSARRIRWDVALVQLIDPIPQTHADPFRTDRAIRVDEEVSVVSYGRGRNNAASRQRACQVLAKHSGVLALSCEAVPGSSGAPVFAIREGRPRVVAVISAIGDFDGREASFATDIEQPLSKLLNELTAGRIFPPPANSARRLTVGTDDRDETGAKFVKP